MEWIIMGGEGKLNKTNNNITSLQRAITQTTNITKTVTCLQTIFATTTWEGQGGKQRKEKSEKREEEK